MRKDLNWHEKKREKEVSMSVREAQQMKTKRKDILNMLQWYYKKTYYYVYITAGVFVHMSVLQIYTQSCSFELHSKISIVL